MHGSNFQLEQALNTKRFSTSELQNHTSAYNNKKEKKLGVTAGLIVLMLSLSTISFAGSSQPKLKGNNGNATGR